jgi:hypothetical protein
MRFRRRHVRATIRTVFSFFSFVEIAGAVLVEA